MSVAQDEIAAQIESIKAEWQQTVQGIESTADAPSGLSRSDFKEWKQLKQQKAKFRLAHLEERLRRLQLLQSRLKVVRGSQVLPDSGIDLDGPGADAVHDPSRRSSAAGSWGGAQQYEYARIATGKSFRAGTASADHPHDMFALPGAVPDSVQTGARRPSTLSFEGDAQHNGFERGLYERPPGLPRSSDEDQYFLESKEMLRQMIRESLRLNLGAHATKLGSSAESTKLRASATLPVDLKSPSKEATAKTSDGTASKSADSTDMLRQGEQVKGAAETAGNVLQDDVDVDGGDALEAAPDNKRVDFEIPENADEEKSAQEADEEKAAQKWKNRKSLLLSQQSWVQRAKMPTDTGPAQIEEAFGVPNTLEEGTEISCPWIFGGFKRTTPIRRFCFNLTRNISFNVFVMLVTLGNSIYIAMAPNLVKSNDSARRDSATVNTTDPTILFILFYFDIGCTIVMGFEVLVAIVAYGFCRSRSTYLRSSGFHKLDAACFLVTILEYLAIYLGLPDVTLRPFRMLRFFKLICKIEMFGGVKSIITTLSEGFPQLMIIFLFLVLTLAAWCILCMAVYSKTFRRRCINKDADIPKCASDFSTGFGLTCNLATERNETRTHPGGEVAVSSGYPFEKWCDILGVETDTDENDDWILPLPFEGAYAPVERGYYDKGVNKWGQKKTFTYPKDRFGRYHTCQGEIWRSVDNFTVTQLCEVVGNPMGGFSHFDNVWGSAVSLAQVMVPDSYYEVWWRLQEGEPWIVWPTRILFMLINVFDTFLLLGLFVAVVTGTFKRIREQSGTDAFITADQRHEMENQEDDAASSSSDKDISGEEAVQKAAIVLTKSRYFEYFVSIAIMVQLVAIALGGENSDQFYVDFSFYSTISCFSVFVLEITLRFLAVGDVAKFWDSLFHRAETILIIFTFFGIVFDLDEFKVLAALRGYRLMRYFPTLQSMLQSAVASVQAIFNVMVFISIVGLCFVVAGRYMFGSAMDDVSRANFGTLSLGALTMFQLFTGDSWSGVMYAAMQTFPNDLLKQFLGAALVLVWFIFASLIAQNLFVAVIIENFQISDTIANIKKPGNIDSIRQQFRRSYARMYRKSRAISSGAVALDVRTGMMSAGAGGERHVFRNSSARTLYQDYASIEEKIRQTVEALAYAAERSANAPDSRMIRAVASVQLEAPKGKEDLVDIDDPERVLFFLLPENPVRKFFMRLGTSTYFDNFILIGIIGSCVFLIIEPPFEDIIDYPGQVEPVSPIVPFSTINSLNQFFTFFFLIEFVCRVMGQGLLFTKHAYLKEGWNIIDTVVLLFSLIDLSGALDGMSLAKVARMARALKPLRLMKRNKNMRLIIDALLTTLQPIAYVILFLIFTLVVFGLIAIGVFGGKLFACTNTNVVYPEGKKMCSGAWMASEGNTNGVLLPSVWQNPYHFNFDSFGSSFMTLFMVSTFKFVAIMWACMDITDVNVSPLQNNSTHWSVFYILYILVGALFVMNLFVAFIIDGFNAAKGSTVQEEIFRRFRRQLYAARPKYETFKPPENVVSTQLRKMLESKVFQAFSTTCVFVNVGMLLADNADADEHYQQVMETQNNIFYGELVFEVVLCTIAYGPLGFYNDFYRAFDLFVCVGSALGYIFNNKAITSFVKVFRLARVIRLAARIRAIKLILETLVGTAPQLTNIVLLLFLVYSMFAVLGVQLFALTRNGARLGPTASFQDFTNALFLIWQIITGDEWMIIMQDISVVEPSCTLLFDPEIEPSYQGPARSWGDCGPSVSVAVGYCLALKLVCEYMMLNLFIGLILDNFSYITEDAGHQEDALWSNGPSEGQLQKICEVFKRYDLGTGHVPISSLGAIMMDLPLPLGYREEVNDSVYLTGNEYMTELLIRAELNLCLRHDNAMREEELAKNRWFKQPEIQQIYINSVDFDTLMSTIAFWRLPSLVPGLIQWQRHERIEECMLMAHGLQIMEFFRKLVSRRKRRKINDQMAKRRAFVHYCEEDLHRKRRNMHTTEIKVKQKDCARDNKLPLLQLLNMPFEDVHELILNWLPVSELPEDILSHSKACQDYQLMRVPQPFTGIEVFKHKMDTHEVVFKVVDPNSHNANHDLLIGDLRKLNWRGWIALNTKSETYYHPVVFNGFDESHKRIVPEPWDRIDMFVRNDRKKGARPKRLGSIEDLQSYVLEDFSMLSATPKSMSETKTRANRAHSFLRVNLGNHQYNSDKVKLQAKHWKDQSGLAFAKHGLKGLKTLGGNVTGKFSGGSSHGKAGREKDSHLALTGPTDISQGDTVLEVVGYIPIVGLGLPKL